MGLFSDLFGAGDTGKATMRAADSNRNILTDSKIEGSNVLDTGQTIARDFLDQGRQAYAPLSQLGMKGAGLYADALGINGAEGNANATSAFQAGPGYQFAMDQGLQALERRGAAQGRLQSGQTGIDTMGFAQGLANQEYGGWLSKLGGYNDMAMGAAGGLANVAGAQAQNVTDYVGPRLSLYGDVSSGYMAANNQQAQGEEARAAAKKQGLGSLMSLGGKALGMATGYGGF